MRSPAIVLTISPDEISTTVQASLFRGISAPLHNLLNNTYGSQAAIKEVLKHDDKDAFLALVSMAYRTVLRGSQGQSTSLTMASTPISNTGNETTIKNLKLPKCPDCRKSPIQLLLTYASCNPKMSNENTVGLSTFFELQFAQQSALTIPTRGGILPLTALDTRDKVTGKRYPLVHFAKVFALATKYEVWGLQFSAVKAFDKRLKKYANEDEKVVDEVLEALKYLISAMLGAASNPITPTTNDSFEAQANSVEGHLDNSSFGVLPTMLLRRLLQYVVAHVDTLLNEEEFREIVAEHGVVGLELMHVLKESMSAFSD